MTQDSLAKTMGSYKAMVSKWVNDKDQPEINTIKRICEATGASFTYLDSGKGEMFDDKSSQEQSSSVIAHLTLPPRKVPVISWVQVGAWAEIVDQFQPGEADDWVQVFKNVSGNTFALRVSGDSMTPEIWPGETIIIDPEVQPETGKYVIAKIESDNGENGEATFKQFVRDGDQIYLKPLNDKYDLLNMTGRDFKIVGCVVQKVKEY